MVGGTGPPTAHRQGPGGDSVTLIHRWAKCWAPGLRDDQPSGERNVNHRNKRIIPNLLTAAKTLVQGGGGGIIGDAARGRLGGAEAGTGRKEGLPETAVIRMESEA